jgi:hypothetical protein
MYSHLSTFPIEILDNITHYMLSSIPLCDCKYSNIVQPRHHHDMIFIMRPIRNLHPNYGNRNCYQFHGIISTSYQPLNYSHHPEYNKSNINIELISQSFFHYFMPPLNPSTHSHSRASSFRNSSIRTTIANLIDISSLHSNDCPSQSCITEEFE